jgi:hypothetical protein
MEVNRYQRPLADTVALTPPQTVCRFAMSPQKTRNYEENKPACLFTHVFYPLASVDYMRNSTAFIPDILRCGGRGCRAS